MSYLVNPNTKLNLRWPKKTAMFFFFTFNIIFSYPPQVPGGEGNVYPAVHKETRRPFFLYLYSNHVQCLIEDLTYINNQPLGTIRLKSNCKKFISQSIHYYHPLKYFNNCCVCTLNNQSLPEFRSIFMYLVVRPWVRHFCNRFFYYLTIMSEKISKRIIKLVIKDLRTWL